MMASPICEHSARDPPIRAAKGVEPLPNVQRANGWVGEQRRNTPVGIGEIEECVYFAIGDWLLKCFNEGLEVGKDCIWVDRRIQSTDLAMTQISYSSRKQFIEVPEFSERKPRNLFGRECGIRQGLSISQVRCHRRDDAFHISRSEILFQDRQRIGNIVALGNGRCQPHRVAKPATDVFHPNVSRCPKRTICHGLPEMGIVIRRRFAERGWECRRLNEERDRNRHLRVRH